MTVPAPVEPRGGLLAVHAHPDDETLATGALLATWAAAGEPVTVVTCTRGEQGEVITRPGTPGEHLGGLEGDGPALAAYRETELAAALLALGVRDQVFLDRVLVDRGALDRAPTTVPDGAPSPRYTDSGMAWAAPGIARAAAEASLPVGAFVGVPLDEAAGRLAAVLRARRPRVVVTYEPGGGYGHPDHVRAHEVTVRAVELAAAPASGGASSGVPCGADEPWAVPEVWFAVVPDEVARTTRRRLAEDPDVRAQLVAEPGLTLPDPDEALPPVARPAAELVGLRSVEVAPVLDRVLGAMRAHATQVQLVTAARGTRCDGPGADGSGTEALGGSDLLGWYALSNDVLAGISSREFYVPSVPGSPAAQRSAPSAQYR